MNTNHHYLAERHFDLEHNIAFMHFYSRVVKRELRRPAETVRSRAKKASCMRESLFAKHGMTAG